MTDSHGWTSLGQLGSMVTPDGMRLPGGRVSVAPIVPERRRCACMVLDLLHCCRREATQEDFLCDPCREGTH